MIVFLPQILILFAFILVLESTGYMVRAAFIMDRLMSSAGLSGRAFIPLLSSFACAVPGIMATRTIDDPKDRLTTILVAPLMTCSARLPVYTLIIAAFIPPASVGPGIGVQGLVLFGLYVAGIAGALLAALVLRRTVVKGGGGQFMMELPKYQVPRLADVAIGLWQRTAIFLKRAGTIILARRSYCGAGQLPQAGPAKSSRRLDCGPHRRRHPHDRPPIGFNKDISLALLPAMAAPEVAVAAIGTVTRWSRDEQGSRLSSSGCPPRGRCHAWPSSLVRFRAAMHLTTPDAAGRNERGSGRGSWSDIFCARLRCGGRNLWTAVAPVIAAPQARRSSDWRVA